MTGCQFYINNGIDLPRLSRFMIVALLFVILSFSFHHKSYASESDLINANCLGDLPIGDIDLGIVTLTCRKYQFQVPGSSFLNPQIGVRYEIRLTYPDPETGFTSNKTQVWGQAAVMNGWGGCVWIFGLTRFCARLTLPGRHGAWGNASPMPRMCVYEDSMDARDTNPNFSPFYQGQAYSDDLTTSLSNMGLDELYEGSETPALSQAFDDTIGALFDSLGAPYNNIVQGIVDRNCLPYPMAPSPPPFFPILSLSDPVLYINRVCKLNEVSSITSPCHQGIVPSSFERPLVRVGIDLPVQVCSSNSAYSAAGSCALVKGTVNTEYARRCTSQSDAGPCVLMPTSSPVKAQYPVNYQLTRTGTGTSVGGSTSTIPWVSLVYNTNYTLKSVSIQTGDYVDLGYHYNGTAGVSESSTLQLSISGQTKTKTIQTNISADIPMSLCVNVTESSNVTELGCVDRPSFVGQIVTESCPVCDLTLETASTCLARKSAAFGASCISVHKAPKMIAGFRATTSGSVSIPQAFAIFSYKDNDTNYLSGNAANKSAVLHGVTLDTTILDENRDKAVVRTVDPGKGISGNFIAPCKNPINIYYKDCTYNGGLVYAYLDYIRGGKFMCIQNESLESLLVKSVSNKASNKSEDVLVPLFNDTTNTLPYKTNSIKNYQDGFPSTTNNYGRDPGSNEIERKKNYVEQGLCVDVPPPTCDQFNITDFQFGGTYKMNYSTVANATSCNTTSANGECRMTKSGTYFDSGLNKNVQYSYDFSWSCNQFGDWQSMQGLSSATTNVLP